MGLKLIAMHINTKSPGKCQGFSIKKSQTLFKALPSGEGLGGAI
jgi:hypothetical protein